MADLKSDWRPGQHYTAAAANAVATRVNAHEAALDQLPTPAAAGSSLSAHYRPLSGIASDIGSVIAAGESLAAQVIPWYQAEGRYRFCGVEPTAVTGDGSLCLNDNNTFGQTYVLQPMTIEFWSNATDIRVHGFHTGRGDYWALVDDMRIMPGWQHGNFADNYYTWTLTQASAQWRKWRLCIPSTLTGISLNAGALIAPTTASGVQIAVVGDSLVQGNITIDNAVAPGTAGVITAGTSFGEFEQFTGLDVWRCSIYGTGYVAQSDFGADGPYGSARRLAKLAALPGMDVVVVFGTVNDSPHSQSAIVSAAQTTWSAIKAAQPGARLIVIGPECLGYPDAAMDAKSAALVAAASAHPDVDAAADLRAAPFITGTGYDGNPQNDGNQDGFTSTDTLHPTHPGHRYWGANLARILGAL